jgi:hypothetical protein
MANHARPFDRRRDEVSLDEVESVAMLTNCRSYR